jgi:hypothetical protein
LLELVNHAHDVVYEPARLARGHSRILAQTRITGAATAKKRSVPVFSRPDHDFACPCCRFFTLDETPPGTFEISEVCGWEDDVQFNDPEFRGGANRSSLNEYRAAFEAKLLVSPNSFSDRRRA